MPKASTSETPYTVPAVNRSIQILRYLQRNKRVTVTDVSQALGIGPSTCYAILKTLQKHNFIAFDERAKTYSLGLALLELGGSVSRDFTSVHKARSHLSTFARNTGLTVFVSARASHEHLLVVDREEPLGDVHISIAIGTRFRITEGLSGRCFMAYLPKDECDALIDSAELHPFASLPAPSPATYRAQLLATKKAGFVTLVDLSQSGSNGVAAPIFDSEGRILFAVAAMGLGPSITGKAIKETGANLRRTTDLITQSLNETAT